MNFAMNYFFVIIVVIYTFSIGLALWINFRKNKERQNVLKQVSQSWNIPDLQSGKIYQAVYEGMEYEYEYFAGTRKYPSYFKVRIKCLSKGEFVIGKESKLEDVNLDNSVVGDNVNVKGIKKNLNVGDHSEIKLN